jgi:hypothetical protein
VDKGPEGPDRRRPRLRPALIRSLVGLVGAYAVTTGVLLVLLAFPVWNQAKGREKGRETERRARRCWVQPVRGISQPSKVKSVQSEAGSGHRRGRGPGSLTGTVEVRVLSLAIIVSV